MPVVVIRWSNIHLKTIHTKVRKNSKNLKLEGNMGTRNVLKPFAFLPILRDLRV